MRRSTIHSKMAIEIRARTMASINACTIVVPPLDAADCLARCGRFHRQHGLRKAANRCVVARIAFGPNLNAHAPVLRNPIADQIGGQALAGYTFGHQALLNVIKIELKRMNERIPGSHTLSFIRFRELLHGIGQSARGRCAGTLLVCNAFERVHTLLQRCYVLGVTWRGAGRAVQLRFKGLFCIFNRLKFFFLIDGDEAVDRPSRRDLRQRAKLG